MAITTNSERMSLIGLGSPVPRMLPEPDASIDSADRALLIFLYHLSPGELVRATGLVRAIFSSKTPRIIFEE
jgi:hypothetical protein